MSVYTLLNSTRNTESRTSGADKYPTSEDAWKNRYNWLHDAYTGEPYQLQDMTAWRLFRAFDTNGNVMAETTRLLRDNAFVIDQDAGALFGAGATLETQDRGIRSARRSLDAGEKIWKRSMLGERLSTYALSLASMGRIGLEVVRTEAAKPWGVTIVAHDPRNYVVTYDVATGLRIERVTITQQVFRTDEIDGSGNVADATLDVHQRELTAEGIRVTLNGEEVRKETGEHRLGAVPFCNLLWQEYREPEHGLHAARAEAVEQDAKGKLEGGEGDEIGGRQRTQIARADAEVALQVGRDHGIHTAEQVGHEIAAGKRQQHAAGDERHAGDW